VPHRCGSFTHGSTGLNRAEGGCCQATVLKSGSPRTSRHERLKRCAGLSWRAAATDGRASRKPSDRRFRGRRRRWPRGTGHSFCGVMRCFRQSAADAKLPLIQRGPWHVHGLPVRGCRSGAPHPTCRQGPRRGQPQAPRAQVGRRADGEAASPVLINNGHPETTHAPFGLAGPGPRPQKELAQDRERLPHHPAYNWRRKRTPCRAEGP